MNTIEVVAAIIVKNSKVLVVQKGTHKYHYLSNKYEFAGGKIEVGESHTEALEREIREELHLDIIVKKHFLTSTHSYTDFKLILHSFICSSKDEEPTLTEHIQYGWLNIIDLKSLLWAEADIPIVNLLQEKYNNL